MSDIEQYRACVERALEEDIGAGDVTTELTVPEDRQASGAFFAREDCVVAGLVLLPLLYDSLELMVSDGGRVAAGTQLASVKGGARLLLTRERTALNFLQRLSGIATNARRYADQVAGTRCRVLDTRKTTPGLRVLEKMASRLGGATNHRMGLYDAVLIKNNHIAAAGGVRPALQAALGRHPIVEIEVRTFDELKDALACGATRLLLDNLTPEEAHDWIDYIDGRASVEISGGVTLSTIRAYADAGADFVSVGAITHSVRAIDINFRLTLDA
jgi:nicotinate-nucleotide pyrophosphorylase (carboxylating)